MRAAKPWQLPSDLLETRKVITDPVHGDIFITELERRIIDSAGFQRLRRVRQLGTTHLVYPGATHSRFAHSLGALSVSQDLIDAVISQELGPHPKTDDLFAEWKTESAENHRRRLAEVTVLARLGGLLHDFTHVAFGHTIEDDLGLLPPHDENFDRYRHYWTTFPDDVQEALERDELARFLRPLILGKFQPKTRGRQRSYAEMVIAAGGSEDRALQYGFVADIVGNTICADLLDYLRRDHLFTGLPLAVGQRYLAYFYVTPTKRHRKHRARMVLRIQRDGRQRADVVTELLKHLRYRYELSERALVHHAKLAADAMLGKALAMWRDDLWIRAALRAHESELENLDTKNVSTLREAVERLHSPNEVEALRQEAETEMENQLRQRGDEGLLEWLRDWTDGDTENRDSRRAAIGALTRDLLNRRLFKPVAHIKDLHDPEAAYDQYQDTENRRALEQGAARFAGVRPTWHVVLWIPDPKMRLKEAEVLVDTGEGITTFVEHERRTRQGGGAEIYDAHRELWGISVFVEEGVKANKHQVDAILAWLAAQLEVRVAELGLGAEANPWDAPDLLAARRVLFDDETFAAMRGDEQTLLEMLQKQRRARGAQPGATITERMDEMREAARALLASHEVTRSDEFVVLAGRDVELYERLLVTSPYDVRSQSHDGLVERFKQEATLLLETPDV